MRVCGVLRKVHGHTHGHHMNASAWTTPKIPLPIFKGLGQETLCPLPPNACVENHFHMWSSHVFIADYETSWKNVVGSFFVLESSDSMFNLVTCCRAVHVLVDVRCVTAMAVYMVACCVWRGGRHSIQSIFWMMLGLWRQLNLKQLNRLETSWLGKMQRHLHGDPRPKLVVLGGVCYLKC